MDLIGEQRKAHLFQPGVSGNPAGRPRQTKQEKEVRKRREKQFKELLAADADSTHAFIELMRVRVPRALKVIDRALREGRVSQMTMMAAMTVLDRSFGRPAQQLDMSVKVGAAEPGDVERLDSAIAKLRTLLAIPAPPIDVTPPPETIDAD